MAKFSRQVLEEVVRNLAVQIRYLKRQIPKFQAPSGSKRIYPGEAEGSYIICYIESASPSERESFLKGLRRLQDYEASLVKEEFRRTPVPPQLQRYTKSMATLASSLLLDQRHLGKIKQCEHCKDWFYARFKSQKFCAAPQKKCQWKAYHTDEWREKNRERNSRYQRKYRKLIFGTKGK